LKFGGEQDPAVSRPRLRGWQAKRGALSCGSSRGGRDDALNEKNSKQENGARTEAFGAKAAVLAVLRRGFRDAGRCNFAAFVRWCGCDNKVFRRLNDIHLLLVGTGYDIVLGNSRFNDRMFRFWISRFNAQGIDGLNGTNFWKRV
jgi:hypothetical protein